jgi:transposase
MKTELEELRAQLSVCPKRPYPIELRERAREYCKRQRAAGVGVRKVSEELGVSHHTVSYWLAGAQNVAKRKSPRGGKLRRLEIQSPVTKRTFTATLTTGVRVEGLRVEDIAALAKALS